MGFVPVFLISSAVLQMGMVVRPLAMFARRLEINGVLLVGRAKVLVRLS